MRYIYHWCYRKFINWHFSSSPSGSVFSNVIIFLAGKMCGIFPFPKAMLGFTYSYIYTYTHTHTYSTVFNFPKIKLISKLSRIVSDFHLQTKDLYSRWHTTENLSVSSVHKSMKTTTKYGRYVCIIFPWKKVYSVHKHVQSVFFCIYAPITNDCHTKPCQK